MKKIIGFFVLLCMLLFSLSCTAFCDDDITLNNAYFPDDDFRNYIGFELGKNDEEILSQGDLDSIIELDLKDMNITSLKGIEYFTKLKWLYCNNTKITELDLSNNKALQHLECSGNTALTKLVVSNITALTKLDCSGNTALTELDLSNITALQHLNCSGNTALTELDLSNNTILHDLYCSNTSITSLDLSNNKALFNLNCSNTSITSLDLSNNKALWNLYCENTKITELDLSKNTALITLSASSEIEKALEFDGEDFFIDLSELVTDIKRIKNVTASAGSYDSATGIFSFNSENIPTAVSYDYLTNNGDKVLPVTINLKNDEIPLNNTYFSDDMLKLIDDNGYDTDKNGSLSLAELIVVTSIKASNKAITSLKGIEYFTRLESLDCSNNSISSLDLSKNTALTFLYCYNNSITSLDLSKNTALTFLNCRDTNISSLELSNNTALTDLYCSNTGISSLELSNNTALKALECSNTGISSLDLSNKPNFISLNCSDTSISSLDLSNNTALINLVCSNTSISSLDLSNNTALTILDCSNTKLTELDLSKNTDLAIFSASSEIEKALEFDGKGFFIDLSKLVTDIKRLKNVTASAGSYDSATGIFSFNFDNIPTAVSYNYLTNKGDKALSVTINLKNGEIPLNNTYFSEDMLKLIDDNGYDTDRNGYLSLAELTAVTSINASNKAITSLKGIEYFTKLETLYCNNTSISSLDVSNNTALQALTCNNTSISSLDVSNNTALKYLYCYNTSITSIDVSNNTALQTLYCNNTSITSIDVSKNTTLEYLNCSNTKLTELDLSKNTALTTLSASSSIKKILEFDGESFFIDLSKVVTDKTRLKNVTANSGSYDPATGIIVFEASALPAYFTYDYETGFGSNYLNVTVNLLKDKGALNEADFNITPPTDLTYDGTVKKVVVTSNLANIGAITVTYKDSNGNIVEPINAGQYTVSIDIAENDSYYGSSFEKSLEISKRLVTVNADDKEIIYGDKPALTYTITSGKLVDGDKFEGSLAIVNAPVNSSNYYCVGAYSKAITQNSLALGDNYELTFISADLVVKPRPINVEWLGTENLVYDNTVKAISAICKNILNGDSLNLTLGGTTEAIEKGSYTAYVAGIDNTDYTISDGAIGIIKNWTIAENTNEITALSLSDWYYGENPNEPVANAIFGEAEFTYSDEENGAFTADAPTNVGKYYVKATVKGTESYAEISKIISFNILPVDIVVSQAPTTTKIQAGDKLEKSVLSGGLVTALGKNIDADFSWKNGSKIMNTAGSFSETVIATPKDFNYQPLEFDVAVVVEEKAEADDNTPNEPDNSEDNTPNEPDNSDKDNSDKSDYTPSRFGGHSSNNASKTYTITFETNGGSLISSQQIAKNLKANMPAKPVKAGYEFEMWCLDKELTAEFDFSESITDNLTLYAKWKEADNSNKIILTVGKKTALVFGKEMTNDVAPKIVDSRAMLPARFVAEALGAEVEWDNESKRVIIKNDNTLIELFIGSKTALVNGKEVELDSSAFVENGRTYTPLRFVAECLNAEVEWIAEEKMIVITK